ncbi:MAG TPA: SpoIID/LytB domain-containing protein [Solirubrobacteraceae bacterium]|nr:SpoIID/LytB domain-containing protein [Solirubrobacteraceae bacterium]
MSQVGADGLALHGDSAQQILSHYYTGTSLGRLTTTHVLRILLQSGLRDVVFSGATRADERPLDQTSTYIASVGANGQIALRSAHGRLLSYLAPPLVVASTAPVTFNGAASSGIVNGRYRGQLVLVPQGSRLEVINRIGIESYLRGVVPSESPASWPAAELQAQAIAARSYAIASPSQNGFNLYADTRSQQYGGANAETPASNAAVAATAGEVVTYAGEPVPAYYFASSGGETESVQNAFLGAPAEPYLTAVVDPYDATHYGPITMSIHSADQRLRGLVDGTLERIVVTKRGVSPRIVSAELVGTGGTTTVSGPTLSAALGLESTWACFTVTPSVASLTSHWARACARPAGLPSAPTAPVGTTAGGTSGPTGGSGATGAGGTQTTSDSAGQSGGAVAPPAG